MLISDLKMKLHCRCIQNSKDDEEVEYVIEQYCKNCERIFIKID